MKRAVEILPVGRLVTYIQDYLEASPLLQDLWVEGEVSNCSRSPSGHVFFTLKDAQGQVRCVLFRGQITSRTILPENGAHIIVHGRLSFYEANGHLQLYIDQVYPVGTGLLWLEFERLRDRLAREGLFDPSRKRPLPRFPRRIGIVTSPAGAVLHDMLTILRRRFPLVEVVLAPALVQGEGAAESICQALAALCAVAAPDVIIVARGGGSAEELWPFNEERVVRAIFAAPRPVVSAVGHETDYTLADFVADLRAPTPSAAAELVVPDQRECRQQLVAIGHRLTTALQSHLTAHRSAVLAQAQRLARLNPRRQIERHRLRLDDLAGRLLAAWRHRHDRARWQIQALQARLEALDPQRVLARGYSLCWHVEGRRLVRTVAQVGPGDRLLIQVADGQIPARVSPDDQPATGGANDRRNPTE